MPPLRERSEDIPELALHFLRINSKRCGKDVTEIDDDAMAALNAYAWPGNVRQLENIITRAVAVSEDPLISLEELSADLIQAVGDRDQRPSSAWPNGSSSHHSSPKEEKFEREERDQHERERLVRALAAAAGNKASAARALGIPRSTLVSRLNKYGLS